MLIFTMIEMQLSYFHLFIELLFWMMRGVPQMCFSLFVTGMPSSCSSYFQVLDECLRAISGFKGTEDLFDDRVTPFTSDCIRMKKVSSAPSYELNGTEATKNESEACQTGTEQWCEAIDKHMPLTLWHTSAMVG